MSEKRNGAEEAERSGGGEYDQVHGKRRDRLLQPDAVLEVPLARCRFFIELEMGTHAITSANEEKAGATLAKVDRYDQFLHGFAEVAGKETWYAKSFSDRFTAELLFVVKSPKRRDNVNEALAEWRKGRVGPQLAVRALTLSDASRELRDLVGAPPRTTEERPFPPPPPVAPPPPSVPLITERELHVLLNATQRFISSSSISIAGVVSKITKASSALSACKTPWHESMSRTRPAWATCCGRPC
jgi:hypothetical protein